MNWVLLLPFSFIVYFIVTWLLRKRTIGQITGRYVFITGCDTGFGRHLALQLDKVGFRVVAGCLTEKGQSELRKEASRRLVPVSLDVTNETSILEARNFVEGCLPSGKGLWAVVNNAGVAGKIGPAEWMTREDYVRTLDVNLLGVIEMSRVFLPLLRRERGRLVNMSSANGSVTVPFFVPYTISKYGVEIFSDSLRPEARKYGVSVHIIKPGMFDTNIRQVEPIVEGLKRSFEGLAPDVRAFYGRGFLAELLTKVKSSPKATTDTSPVVNAYVHAVTSRHPQYRYHVGLDAHTFWRLLGWLPDSLSTILYTWVLPSPQGALRV
ncbi:retinol dehydrogenase 16-like [Liolophura sinensis]|uniref:retinol dehydrogenase 16-like n=1 Tax=Liolophura sinensis TaxID=3198878 RepID=UPI0031597DE9